MKHLKLFAALCCAATLFAACDKTDEPTNSGQQETTNPTNGHEYVDLGLPSGLKWATMNVGAIAPEAYGDYYAWGETAPKKNYDWNTYKHCTYYWHEDKTGDDWEGWWWEAMTKYNTNSDYGTVDNKTTLEAADDAAHVKWGGAWRIPTRDDWQELIDNCGWIWTDDHNGTGVAGNIAISKHNGNSIFFPITGSRCGDYLEYENDYGYYWSSSLLTEYPECGITFAIENDYYDAVVDNGIVGFGALQREEGCVIRPVLK